MSVQVKGSGTIGGLDEGLNVVGVVTATSFSGAFSGTTGTYSGTVQVTSGNLDIADSIRHVADSNTKMRFPTADTISFETAGTERLRITSAGEVKINYAAAGQTVLSLEGLYDGGSNTSVDIATFARQGNAVKSAIRYNDPDTSIKMGTTTTHSFDLMTSGTERLRVDSTGRVIIANGGSGGTADVNADNFVVKNYTNSGSCGISILNVDNQNSTLYFGNASDNKHAEVVWSDASNLFLIGTSNAGASIKFRTADQSDALFINSNGKTLIGDDSNGNAPRTRLEVLESHDSSGAGTFTPVMRLSTTAYGTEQGPQLQFGTTNSSYPTWTYGDICAGYEGGAFGGALIFRTNSGSSATAVSERGRWTRDGNLNIKDGNLVIQQSGHGIDFSSTGDASGMSNELLDDYEEGSWTPTILGWDTFTHYSGSSYYAGWYVKVGGMVHCGWKIYYQNLSTPSSNAHIRISGLPYAAKTISAGPNCHVRFDIPDFSFSGYPVPYLAGNETTIGFYKQVSGSNNISAINATSNYSNNWTMGTATYATN